MPSPRINLAGPSEHGEGSFKNTEHFFVVLTQAYLGFELRQSKLPEQYLNSIPATGGKFNSAPLFLNMAWLLLIILATLTK